MDCGRALAALLILAGLVAADRPLPLREANWLTPAEQLRLLTTRPEECLSEAPADVVGEVYGSVAFRDPMLLGGQAARAGLSCMSCHRGGRGNTGFQFPGLSGSPGTADVTSSLMSSYRGDGRFNPRPIPDLTFSAHTVSRTDPAALEHFIRGVIVEEFDGPPPPPAVLKGLVSYVRGLDPKYCVDQADPRFGLANSLADYFVALGAAETALADKDKATALVMLRAARSVLGTIDARYAGLDTAPLDEADRALAGFQKALRSGGDPGPVADAVHRRWAGVRSWAKPLYPGEARSLYNPDVLKTALAR